MKSLNRIEKERIGLWRALDNSFIFRHQPRAKRRMEEDGEHFMLSSSSSTPAGLLLFREFLASSSN
jgi:hypothetical protein